MDEPIALKPCESSCINGMCFQCNKLMSGGLCAINRQPCDKIAYSETEKEE